MRSRAVPRISAGLGVAGALLALAAVSFAQQPKTQRFELELNTTTQAMPFKLPNLPNMPNMPRIPGLGGPQQTINGTATYGAQAAEPIFVTVPADLKLPQNKLVLHLPKPVPATVTPQQPAGPGQMPTGTRTFTSKLYWHPETAQGPIESSATIDMSQAAGRGGMGGPQFRFTVPDQGAANVADGSDTPKNPQAVGAGDYVLNTGGTAALDGFLPAIEVTDPESLSDVDLAEGFNVVWKPVTGARGYILHAMGMIGNMMQSQNMTVIQWVSTLNEPPERVRHGYQQETTISDDLQNGILLPADATSCKVPPKVFDGDFSMFTLTITAVGNDFYSDADGITVYGKIRSEWTSTVMPGMAGMMGIPGMGQP
jgi:hypothetical protein